MSAARIFFDTNVLLCMYGGDAAKRTRAQQLFQQYAREGQILLSTQVVQEFYAAGSQNLRMPRRDLREAVEALLELPLVVVGPAHILAATETEAQYEISFLDALIVTAAEAGGAEILLTEQLNHGQRYRSVLVENPFRG